MLEHKSQEKSLSLTVYSFLPPWNCYKNQLQKYK